jgi:hypothetical protein
MSDLALIAGRRQSCYWSSENSSQVRDAAREAMPFVSTAELRAEVITACRVLTISALRKVLGMSAFACPAPTAY